MFSCYRMCSLAIERECCIVCVMAQACIFSHVYARMHGFVDYLEGADSSSRARVHSPTHSHKRTHARIRTHTRSLSLSLFFARACCHSLSRALSYACTRSRSQTRARIPPTLFTHDLTNLHAHARRQTRMWSRLCINLVPRGGGNGDAIRLEILDIMRRHGTLPRLRLHPPELIRCNARKRLACLFSSLLSLML